MRCGLAYKAKKNENGVVYRLKNRLVAKGHSQKPGIDYCDPFTSIEYKIILKFVLTFALHFWCELFQLDIDTAYLYGSMKETVYMIQQEDFDDGSSPVCVLENCMHGREEHCAFAFQISWNRLVHLEKLSEPF